MNRCFKSAGVFSLLLLLFFSQPLAAQKKKKKKDSKEKTEVKKDATAPKKISELTKKSIKQEGLFTIYQDSTNGSIKMELSENHLGKEYIYFNQIADGLLEAGAFRGSYKGSKVIKIKKFFDRIEFIEQNTSYYFDPESPLAKAANANINESVLASLKIEGIDTTNGLYLVDADELFLKETFTTIKPAKHPKASPTSFSLGKLDKDKTKVLGIRNYPKNTDLVIYYVYSHESVLNRGSEAATNAKNVGIKVFHSLIEMPENDYEPLLDDPRVGYFTTKVDDKTSKSPTPYRDLVHRWNLKKKNPEAEVSEPVEPIVWWMENTTPLEIRPIIKSAGERWNRAFEKAGFKDAIVIKQQPDDAEWDAGDIRYNVLRWTSSPRPPFGGYGPSFVNPRTGQILGADIMLEFISLTNNLRTENIFEPIGFEDLMNDFEASYNESIHLCHAAEYAQLNNLFAGLTSLSLDQTDFDKSKIINEFLHYLILHEMGHTLGLNHNMKATHAIPLASINDTILTSKTGLSASVMDYPLVNVSKDRSKQGHYWSMTPGTYDDWAIEFAYRDFQSKDERVAHLAKSTQPELIFGNDADDMRSPGKGIDPRVNVSDLSDDPITYAIERIDLAQEVARNLLAKNLEASKGNSHHYIRTSYSVLLAQQMSSVNTISRYIGGVYVDRAFIGQEGASKPFIPVELEKQKTAMNALNKHLFAPNAFDLPNELFNYLQLQRRGFGFFANSEDPKVHSQLLSIQKNVLSHLLHPSTTQRIVDSELYGNEYSLSTMMTDLNSAIFKLDISGNVNTFRQNLQVAYTEMLIDALSENNKMKYLPTVQSMMLYNLKQVKLMAANSTGNISSKAHKMYLAQLIDNALEDLK